MLIRVLRDFLSSKKGLALIAGVLGIAASRLGLNISPEDLEKFVQLIMGYLIAQSVADFGKSAERLRQKGGDR
jgi:hypothetical protein